MRSFLEGIILAGFLAAATAGSADARDGHDWQHDRWHGHHDRWHGYYGWHQPYVVAGPAYYPGYYPGYYPYPVAAPYPVAPYPAPGLSLGFYLR